MQSATLRFALASLILPIASATAATTVFSEYWATQPSGSGWTPVLYGDAVGQPWTQGTHYETAFGMLQIYSVPDPVSNNAYWGSAGLTHSFSPISGDFIVTSRFIYNQGIYNTNPMQNASVMLFDNNNLPLVSVGWSDAWLLHAGGRFASGAGSYYSSFGTAPYNDDVTITIERTAGTLSATYYSAATNQTYNLFSSPNVLDTIAGIGLISEFYNYPGSLHTPISFGNTIVTAVPEPATTALLLTAATLTLRRRRPTPSQTSPAA